MPTKAPTFEGFGRHVPGEGPKPCAIAIVGEAPGFNEDQQGRPFVGQAGQLLNDCLRRVGLTRGQVYITNVVKRRPPENRKPTGPEIKVVLQELDEELVQVQPTVTVVMGDVALRALGGRTGITKFRGVEFEYQGRLILPTFHPAYALRNPAMTEAILTDLRRAVTLVTRRPVDDVEVQIIRGVGDFPPGEFERLINLAEVVAYDVETTGLDPLNPAQEMLGIGLAVEPAHAYYLLPDAWWILASFPRSIKWTAHNGKFDNRWLRRYGIEVNQTFDTMLAAYVLDENRSTYKLERLAVELLGVSPYHDETDALLAAGRGAEIPPEVLGARCGRDCVYTLRLYHHLRSEIIKDLGLRRVFQHLLMPSSRLLERVEETGLPLDMDLLRERKEMLRKAMEQHLQAMGQIAGTTDLNLNSTKVLIQVLYTQLGLPIVKHTPTGRPSTDKEVLMTLKEHSPFVQHLMDYRRCKKFDGTYYQRWMERAA